MASLKDRLGCTAVLVGGAVVLVLFVVAVGRSMKPDRSAPATSTSAPARPGVEMPGTRALLDGIGVGDSVAGWRIASTRIDKGGRLMIDVRQGKKAFSVWLVPKGKDTRLAPEHSDKYDFYSGWARTTAIPAGAESKVLEAIVERVKRTENKVPVPPGL